MKVQVRKKEVNPIVEIDLLPLRNGVVVCLLGRFLDQPIIISDEILQAVIDKSIIVGVHLVPLPGRVLSVDQLFQHQQQGFCFRETTGEGELFFQKF